MESPLLPLLRLVDDETSFVRDEVRKKLLSHPGLEEELRPHWDGLSASRQEILGRILREKRLEDFHFFWGEWFQEKPETARLEKGLASLVFLETGENAGVTGTLLDQLAADFTSADLPFQPGVLMGFLFGKGQYRTNDSEYYHPDNSLLTRVIRQGRGLPISLVSIAILTGDRLGIQISGCNFPRHFLASTVWNGELEVYDCYRGGRRIPPAELKDLLDPLPEKGRGFLRPAKAEDMIARVLRNLAVAWEHQGEPEFAAFYQALEKELGQLLYENE